MDLQVIFCRLSKFAASIEMIKLDSAELGVKK